MSELLIEIELQDRDTFIWPKKIIPYQGTRFSSLDGELGTMNNVSQVRDNNTNQTVWVAQIKWDNETFARHVRLVLRP